MGLFQQLPQQTDVVLVPGLLGQVHFRRIQLVFWPRYYRCRQFLGLLSLLLRRLGFVALRLGGEPLLVFGIPGPAGHNGLPTADARSHDQCPRHHRRCRKCQLITSPRLLESVNRARRPGHHRFVVEMPLEVGGQTIGRLVTPRPVLLQAFHHNPIQVVGEYPAQNQFAGPTVPRHQAPLLSQERAQARGRPFRFLLQDDPLHLLVARAPQPLLREGRRPGQQFVEQHPQAVDVAARIHIQTTHLGLLRAHVGRRANHRAVVGEDGLLGQVLVGGFGHAEVNDHGHRHAAVERDQDVGGLEVPVNDPLLVRALDRLGRR